MDLKLSPDERALHEELGAWLDANYPFEAALQRVASGAARDAAIWHGLVAGGWIARALPRRADPQGSAIDASIIAEAFGRAVVVEPFFRSAFLAAHLLQECAPGDDSDAEIDAIGRGERRYAAALYEPESRFRPEAVTSRAIQDGDSWRLSGRKAMVFDGGEADRLLVSARSDDGELALFRVAGDAPGLSRVAFATIDDVACADLTFDGVPADLVAQGEQVAAGVVAAVDRAITALGAEVVGAADAALDETARYTARREQFGKPIAGFQVVSHRLARMFIELEALRGGVLEALSAASGGTQERAAAAAGLKVLVGENGRYVVNQGIQLHGGVGTVNDYKVSHCFKRVFALETLYGNADFHLGRYADAMA